MTCTHPILNQNKYNELFNVVTLRMERMSGESLTYLLIISSLEMHADVHMSSPTTVNNDCVSLDKTKTMC